MEGVFLLRINKVNDLELASTLLSQPQQSFVDIAGSCSGMLEDPRSVQLRLVECRCRQIAAAQPLANSFIEMTPVVGGLSLALRRYRQRKRTIVGVTAQ
jgi:hypothetical protein